MPVRRQSSATSLSKYAIAKSPGVDLYNGSRSRDFCNSFWGLSDAGVDILLERMRGAARTTEDLRNYWRERSLIEEEYATRLSNLAKTTLGKDEIGELRNSLDTLRLETDNQATFHLQLAEQIRTDMEGQVTAFCAKQTQHKKTQQSVIEKKLKAKQTQESYVNKAREKYEADLQRINTYGAQASALDGKDLERLQLKLQRAQQTVQANEKDLTNFVKTLREVLPKWEEDWKGFCDSCQDLEEERLEFLRENIWTYANAVSTLCVADDMACEKIRVALDQMEPDKDMENFVRDYGTGNTLPDLPLADGNAQDRDSPGSSSHSRGSRRRAKFTRATKRSPTYRSSTPSEPTSPGNGRGRGNNQPPEATKPSTASPPNRGHTPNPTENKVVAPVTVPLPKDPTPQPLPVINGQSSRPSEPPTVYIPDNPPRRVTITSPINPPTSDPTQPPQEDGVVVLFYVKALYDYTATIDEEFDFQAGDVIAVTATPDDGWWSGELLDEARRKPGKNVFPSNFVVLF